MTAGLSSFTTPGSYWQASRAPRYSLLFALPLLLFYQTLAVLLSHGARSVRNGADVILQSLFVALAGNWGPLLFMLCLIGGGLDRKSTRLNSSHDQISYAVFCLKKKNQKQTQ